MQYLECEIYNILLTYYHFETGQNLLTGVLFFIAQKGGEEHRNYHHHPDCSKETD